MVEPALTDQGWRFGDSPGADRDTLNGATFLHEIYTLADLDYTGRATVPVLWDKQRRTIVNNESADILRMFSSGFGALVDDSVDLYPVDLRAGIDALNDEIYPKLNNGVYRAGFATTQLAYEEAFADVFAMLDALERRLAAQGPFLSGERPVETDVRLFVTAVRFDAAYNGLFKCNLRRLKDYVALSAWLKRMIEVPGLRDRQHRPYQARLLFDQSAQPQWNRSTGSRPFRPWPVRRGMSLSLVIFLHGVNANGADLAPLGNLWRGSLPQTYFAAPDAPFSSGYGYEWFSLDGVTPENRPGRVAAARQAFDKVLRKILSAHGLSGLSHCT